MCGIVGYIGDRQAYPILINGLKRLEYRGYDSAGIALALNGHVNVEKQVGKIAALEELVGETTPDGSLGIAHTRWATHGEPNKTNAHPHTDGSGNIVLAHNGITPTEVFSELKRREGTSGIEEKRSRPTNKED